MAKNRKNQPAAVRFGPVIKAFVLCAIIGGAGVGYVWQKGKITALWRQITSREKHLIDLQAQNEKLKKQLAMMRSPQFLEMRVKELNLGLMPPSASQFWRLNEPAGEEAPAGSGPLYAQKTGALRLR